MTAETMEILSNKEVVAVNQGIVQFLGYPFFSSSKRKGQTRGGNTGN